MPSPRDIPFSPATPEDLRACFPELRAAGQRLQAASPQQLLSVLLRLGELWKPEGQAFPEARQMLRGVFSDRAVESALLNLSRSLSGGNLQEELDRELGRHDLLERWEGDSQRVGFVKGYPLGVVAQILAGNVFLNGIVGLAQCLLTRNAMLLKLPSGETGFTSLFARTLIEADTENLISPALILCRWRGAEEAFNQVLREEADGIVVWGGEQAIAAYPAERCRGRVIHYGPRLGVGFVLSGVDGKSSAESLAWDVALWEQRACSSPRVLFVQDEGSGSFPAEFAGELNRALSRIQETVPAPALSLDAKAEVLSLRELAWWGHSAEIIAPEHSMMHTVLLCPALPEVIPVGNRTVFIVPFRNPEQIPDLLKPLRDGIQTAVLAAPPQLWPRVVPFLVQAGLTQVTAPGSAASRFLGLPHEGEFSLRRLVRLIAVDLGAGPLTYPERDPSALSAIGDALEAGQ